MTLTRLHLRQSDTTVDWPSDLRWYSLTICQSRDHVVVRNSNNTDTPVWVPSGLAGRVRWDGLSTPAIVRIPEGLWCRKKRGQVVTRPRVASEKRGHKVNVYMEHIHPLSAFILGVAAGIFITCLWATISLKWEERCSRGRAGSHTDVDVGHRVG